MMEKQHYALNVGLIVYFPNLLLFKSILKH